MLNSLKLRQIITVDQADSEMNTERSDGEKNSLSHLCPTLHG